MDCYLAKPVTCNFFCPESRTRVRPGNRSYASDSARFYYSGCATGRPCYTVHSETFSTCQAKLYLKIATRSIQCNTRKTSMAFITINGIHTRKKCFRCDACGESFMWRAQLSKHQLIPDVLPLLTNLLGPHNFQTSKANCPTSRDLEPESAATRDETSFVGVCLIHKYIMVDLRSKLDRYLQRREHQDTRQFGALDTHSFW